MTESLLTAGTDNEPVIDESKDYLSELVGPGKKFANEKELAKGKYHADLTVEIYKTRLDQLRDEYKKLHDENSAKANIQELINQAINKTNENTNAPVVQEKPSIDMTEIESLVSKKILETKSQEISENNFRTVKNKLIERYGNNYSSVLQKQIEELGLQMDDIDALARRSPNALFRTLGLDQPASVDTFQSPPRSANISTSFKPTTQKRTWAYYQELKKANPKLYFDPKVAVQMQKDAIELGDAFKDGDFRIYGD